MDDRWPRRGPWQGSRSAGSGSSSDGPPEYAHPFDTETAGGAQSPERPATDPFAPPETTRLVPVGPARSPRTDEPDWPDDEPEPMPDDMYDAQAPVFAQDEMRSPEKPRADEGARFVSRGTDQHDDRGAPAGRPTPRPPASFGDQPVGPTPPADLFEPRTHWSEPGAVDESPRVPSGAAPPWVSTSAGRAIGVLATSLVAQPTAGEIVVRIELVISDQTGRVAGAQPPATESPATEPRVGRMAAERKAAAADSQSAPARSSAPVRAAVQIVALLVLVAIGLFLVQLWAWLVR